HFHGALHGGNIVVEAFERDDVVARRPARSWVRTDGFKLRPIIWIVLGPKQHQLFALDLTARAKILVHVPRQENVDFLTGLTESPAHVAPKPIGSLED